MRDLLKKFHITNFWVMYLLLFVGGLIDSALIWFLAEVIKHVIDLPVTIELARDIFIGLTWFAVGVAGMLLWDEVR